MKAPGHLPRLEREDSVVDAQICARGNHVDAVGHDRHSARRLGHGQPRRPGEDARQHARALGIQMLDDDEGNPYVRRNGTEDAPDGVEAARRCPEPDDADLEEVLSDPNATCPCFAGRGPTVSLASGS